MYISHNLALEDDGAIGNASTHLEMQKTLDRSRASTSRVKKDGTTKPLSPSSEQIESHSDHVVSELPNVSVSLSVAFAAFIEHIAC